MSEQVSPSTLDELTAAVNKLYDTRNRYFELNPIETAKQKKDTVAKIQKQAIELVTKLQNDNPELSSNVSFLYLKGKIYNVTEEHDSNAEKALSKAVKLDPKHIDGWNELGECFWKNRDLAQAKTCFESANQLKENKISARSLSMLMRQIGTSDIERNNNLDTSLDLAKAAIKCDLTDGHSWFILGNTYLAMFFSRMETVEHVKQALKAYRKAETDKTEGTNNPDLHMNRATIHRYQEDFSLAIEGFQLAVLLDPDWAEPAQALASLKERLQRIHDTVSSKGGIVADKLSSMVDVLKYTDSEDEHMLLSSLKEGINFSQNVRLVVLTVLPDSLPQSYVAVDRSGACVCVTVYNMDQGVIKANDTVEIPEPYFKNVKVNVGTLADAKPLEFPSIRVDNPVTLKVGGVALGEEKLAKARLTVTTKAE